MRLSLLWVCLLQPILVLSVVSLHDDHEPKERRETVLWNHGKPKTLFARRGVVEYQKLRTARLKVEPVPAAPRCLRAMESCAPNSRCCDPCASCHCRFFNAICYCWRLSRHCPKKI